MIISREPTRERRVRRQQAKYASIFTRCPNLERPVMLDGHQYASLSIAAAAYGMSCAGLRLVIKGWRKTRRISTGQYVPIECHFVDQGRIIISQTPKEPV